MNRAPSAATGRVEFVGSGPGDPGLLTVRAHAALAAAPLIVTDPAVPEAILAVASPDAEVRSAVGLPSDIAGELVAAARAGRRVTRLVGGDPLTVDSVVQEAIAVAAAGVPFDVIPGVPTGTAVPAYAGVPIGSVHVEADVRVGVDWPRLAATPGVLVLHANPSQLAEVATGLTEFGMAAQTPVAVTSSGTTTRQKTVELTLGTLPGGIGAGLGSAAGLGAGAGEVEGPLVLTVGPEVGLRSELSWWESRALYGWRVLVPRTKDQAGAMTERLAVHGAERALWVLGYVTLVLVGSWRMGRLDRGALLALSAAAAVVTLLTVLWRARPVPAPDAAAAADRCAHPIEAAPRASRNDSRSSPGPRAAGGAARRVRRRCSASRYV